MKGIRAFAVVGALLFTLGLGVSPSNAASSSISGTVNCTGSYTVYSTYRKMAEPYQTQMYLSKAAHSTRGGVGMVLGIHTKIANHKEGFVSANRWGTFQRGYGYVKGTSFRVGASMDKSAGACTNSWAGTLHF